MRHSEMDEIPIKNVNTVRKPAIEMFKILLTLGFKINERKIIKDGTVRSMVAYNKLYGVFNKFLPLINPSTFPGTYNSK